MQVCRAALLGAGLTLAACDVASFANDPKPILEQTWNLPASSTSISVASLLPSGVSIYSTPASNPADSSAFQINLANVNSTRRAGDDCAQCETLHGTNAVKPAFTIAVGNSSALPTNVVSGSLVGGTVNYSAVNNLSFDPLRVNTVTANPQGYMIVVIHSGTQILGRDSINGASMAFPAGTTLSRTIALSAGVITGPIAVDLTVSSPQGDHIEFIDANGTMNIDASIANLRVADVRVNVPNTSITNTADTLDLADLDRAITDKVTAATLEMTIDNPWTVAGNLNIDFNYAPAQSVSKTIVLPAATAPPAAQVRSVSLSAADMQQLFGHKVVLSVSGGVSSAAPVTVTPKQSVTIANRLILTIRTGS